MIDLQGLTQKQCGELRTVDAVHRYEEVVSRCQKFLTEAAEFMENRGYSWRMGLRLLSQAVSCFDKAIINFDSNSNAHAQELLLGSTARQHVYSTVSRPVRLPDVDDDNIDNPAYSIKKVLESLPPNLGEVERDLLVGELERARTAFVRACMICALHYDNWKETLRSA